MAWKVKQPRIGPQWPPGNVVAGRDQRPSCRRAACGFASSGFADLLRPGWTNGHSSVAACRRRWKSWHTPDGKG
jgi:hypothetical protein